MDPHHAAHYAIAGALFCALVGVGAVDHPIRPPAPPMASDGLVSALDRLAEHSVDIYCLPTSCALAKSLAAKLTAAGWKRHNVYTAAEVLNDDVGVISESAFSLAVSNSLPPDIPLKVSTPPQDWGDRPWEIWIGNLTEDAK